MRRIHERILVGMLKRGVAGKDPIAKSCEDHMWPTSAPGRKKTSVPRAWREPVSLSKVDGDVLTEEGYLSFDKFNRCWSLTRKGVEFAIPHVKIETIDPRAVFMDLSEGAAFSPFEMDNLKYPGETPVPLIYRPGSSNLALILGENASGKSFFRRLLQYITHPGSNRVGQEKIERGEFPVSEFIHLSMEGRTKSSMFGNAIYGNERVGSTGVNSSHTVSTGISTCQARSHTSIMYWDEPDIGMSRGVAAGAGKAIAAFVQSATPLVQMVCVTSHSVALVQQLQWLDPHYIYLGDADGPKNLDEWFEHQENPVVVTPEEIQARSRHRYQLIKELLRG